MILVRPTKIENSIVLHLLKKPGMKEICQLLKDLKWVLL